MSWQCLSLEHFNTVSMSSSRAHLVSGQLCLGKCLWLKNVQMPTMIYWQITMYNIYTKLGMLNNARIFVASVFNSELASNFTNLKLDSRLAVNRRAWKQMTQYKRINLC